MRCPQIDQSVPQNSYFYAFLVLDRCSRCAHHSRRNDRQQQSIKAAFPIPRKDQRGIFFSFLLYEKTARINGRSGMPSARFDSSNLNAPRRQSYARAMFLAGIGYTSSIPSSDGSRVVKHQNCSRSIGVFFCCDGS